MRSLLLFLAIAAAGQAAMDGTVVNRTTGQPQPGATVTIMQLGQGGMTPAGSVTTDAQGKFRFEQSAAGAHLIQATHQGVSYSRMIQPGSPTTGIEVEVFDTSKKPGEAVVSQHVIFLQPSGGQLAVNEAFFFDNPGKTTYSDPAGGTLRFYLPDNSEQMRVMATAPGGMPVQRAAEGAGEKNVYKVDFPIKPGESRIDVNYALPLSDPGKFSGKTLYKNTPIRIAAPAGVTLTGEGLEPLGQEPSTQAQIFAVKGASYEFEIAGTGMLSDGAQEEESGPSIQQILPKVYENATLILAATFLVLAFGFILLYRTGRA